MTGINGRSPYRVFDMNPALPTRLLFLSVPFIMVGCAPIPAPVDVPDVPAILDIAPDSSATDTPDPIDSASQCTADDECHHLDQCCLEGRCLAGTCQVLWRYKCCATPGACGGVSAIYDEQCDAPCEANGCRAHLATQGIACQTVGGWTADMGLSGWTRATPEAEGRVQWHLAGDIPFAGSPTIRASDLLCPTYFNGPLDAACKPQPSGGRPVDIQIASPSLLLPVDTPIVAIVWIWLEVETPEATAPQRDILEIRGISEFKVTPWTWTSVGRIDSGPGWNPIALDMSALAGEAASLEFRFMTTDGTDNDHPGVAIGPIRFRTACAQVLECPESSACGVPTQIVAEPLSDTICIGTPPDPATRCTPCGTDADCTSDDPCQVGTCDVGGCQFETKPISACCPQPPPWTPNASFETPDMSGWTLAALTTASGWHRTPTMGSDGEWSLRFGVENQSVSALPGERASGSATSSAFTLPAARTDLLFNLMLSTEWDLISPGPNPQGLDRLKVHVAFADFPVDPILAWDSGKVGDTTNGVWAPQRVDLSAWAGHRIRLVFSFDTIDGFNNQGLGAFIDALGFDAYCPGRDGP